MRIALAGEVLVGLMCALITAIGCAKDPAPVTRTGTDAGEDRPGDAGIDDDADFVVTRPSLSDVNVRLVFSSGAEAVAHYVDPNGGHVRRYRKGVWEAPLDSPAGTGFLGAALSPDGTARFAWASGWSDRSSLATDTYDLIALTLSGEDVWSGPVRFGDTGIGWWQEPTAPAPVVAIDETGLSTAAWPRIDQANPSWPTAIWGSVAAPGSSWSAAPLEDLPGSQAGAPSIVLRGAGAGLVAWTTFDGNIRQLLLANLVGAAWGPPLALDEGSVDVGFGTTADSLLVTGDSSGPAVCAYFRSDAQGGQVIARHSADGLTWSVAEPTGIMNGLSLDQIVGNRKGQVVTTWRGTYRGGSPLTVRFYSPDAGWSAPSEVEGASSARIALAADGRAALVYPWAADSNVLGSGYWTQMVLRRYVPGIGWGPTEIFHRGGGAVTGLGFAGDDLVVAWRDSTENGLVKTFKGPL